MNPTYPKPPRGIQECRVLILRESPIPTALPASQGLPLLDSPEPVASLVRSFFDADPSLDWEKETLFVLCLNARRRLMAWQKVSDGLLDQLLVHPREVFRLAVVANAASICVAHNHPSGDAYPSEADARITRELVRAGQVLKIEVVDHVIVGNPNQPVPGSRGYASLRELGHFYL